MAEAVSLKELAFKVLEQREASREVSHASRQPWDRLGHLPSPLRRPLPALNRRRSPLVRSCWLRATTAGASRWLRRHNAGVFTHPIA